MAGNATVDEKLAESVRKFQILYDKSSKKIQRQITLAVMNMRIIVHSLSVTKLKIYKNFFPYLH